MSMESDLEKILKGYGVGFDVSEGLDKTVRVLTLTDAEGRTVTVTEKQLEEERHR